MKFGGTSVGDINKIKKAAERIKKEISQDNSVVAVVSAMAGETNKLIKLVKKPRKIFRGFLHLLKREK